MKDDLIGFMALILVFVGCVFHNELANILGAVITFIFMG